MTYSESIEYLYNAAPLFQNIGAGAYKEGLENTHRIDEYFGYPHRSYRTIHVAGTNGKGSVSHTLASILQTAGYKVGLYTSPHLVDFRERIRVNGEMISKERVIHFVEEDCPTLQKLSPSFFELVTGLAFKYFQEEAVDIAVIEVGLGGRLDCTNIINPMLSVITNISFDHTQFLGNTLPQIATEKAGIIKDNTPVVVGETSGNKDVKDVFTHKALETKSKIVFADELNEVISCAPTDDGGRLYETRNHGKIVGDLGGDYQEKNMATVLAAFDELRKEGLKIDDEDIRNGILYVTTNTGLMGRWQTIQQKPRVICDTGHNVAGISYVANQLQRQTFHTLYIIIGMVSDKDVSTVLKLLPRKATYLFTQASVKRAMPVSEFAARAEKAGLQGKCYPNVGDAYRVALEMAQTDDLIFVGGSSYIVADLLTALNSKANNDTDMKEKQNLITIEEHFTDPRLTEADAKWRPKTELTKEQREVMAFFSSRMNLTDQLTDLAKQRIPHMNEHGIRMQILSYTSLIGEYVPAEEAVKIARQANDIMAERVKEHPDRFRAMATLALADPEAAAVELERCVKELGFVGVLLYGQYKGHWLEEAQFLPIFEKAAELDVPIYLHPTLVNATIQEKLYMSPAYSAITGAELSSAAIGWHYNVGIQAVRLILSGLFDKLPTLKVISGHWGEGIPMFLDRMNHQLTPDITGLQHDFAYYYKRNIYLTPSGIMSDINLRTMVELMGADHILYAEDYPYEQPENFYEFLMQSSLTDEQKELIAHKNVERLYHLKK